MSKSKTQQREQKNLKIDSLIEWFRSQFMEFPDSRAKNRRIKLVDALLSGFAMFSLKDPSLLFFNNNRTERGKNLKTVYKIGDVPSDTGMRTILDGVRTEGLRAIFRRLVGKLRQAGVWKEYQYYQGHLVCSIDGVHHFSSESVQCEKCLVYEKQNGHREHRHYMLSGAVVHPDKKEVMPVVHEPIVRQDGHEKNDCERNAAKRLLPELRKLFPKEKIVVVEDALGANGPHLRALSEEDFRFVTGVKPDGNKYLFDLMERLEKQGKVHVHEEERDGVLHRYRYANGLPLNSDNRDVQVNFLEYWEIDPKGKSPEKHFSWATDLALTKKSVQAVMRMGRSRWKIENETFNTLKNQGYNFEHNYGHGKDNLCTVLALLMMLAFWADQIQQGWNGFFKKAWAKTQTKASLWEKIRSKFSEFEVASMEMIYLLITGEIKVKCEFYRDTG